MARTVTKIRKRQNADTFGGNRAPKELTLEEARATYEMGTRERLFAELKALEVCKAAAREQTNATNRQKTQAGKAFTAHLMAQGIEVGKAEVHMGDTAYGYDYSTSDTIPAEKLYELFEKKKITKDQFLRSISVSKDAAKRNIGEHILVTITDDKKGKTLDIRTRELDVPAKEETLVINTPKPKPAGKLNRANENKPGSAVRAPVKRIRRMRVIR